MVDEFRTNNVAQKTEYQWKIISILYIYMYIYIYIYIYIYLYKYLEQNKSSNEEILL